MDTEETKRLKFDFNLPKIIYIQYYYIVLISSSGPLLQFLRNFYPTQL